MSKIDFYRKKSFICVKKLCDIIKVWKSTKFFWNNPSILIKRYQSEWIWDFTSWWPFFSTRKIPVNIPFVNKTSSCDLINLYFILNCKGSQVCISCVSQTRFLNLPRNEICGNNSRGWWSWRAETNRYCRSSNISIILLNFCKPRNWVVWYVCFPVRSWPCVKLKRRSLWILSEEINLIFEEFIWNGPFKSIDAWIPCPIRL